VDEKRGEEVEMENRLKGVESFERKVRKKMRKV
jgi:hypothetical protein